MRPLNFREKLLAAVVGLCVIVVAADRLILTPTRQRIETLTRVVPEKATALQTVLQQGEKARQLQAALAVKPPRAISGDMPPLLPLMEQILEREELSRYTKTLQAQQLARTDGLLEEGLEMELANLPAQRVVDFLLDVHQAHRHVRIRQLRLRRSAQNPGNVHCELQWTRIIAPKSDDAPATIN